MLASEQSIVASPAFVIEVAGATGTLVEGSLADGVSEVHLADGTLQNITVWLSQLSPWARCSSTHPASFFRAKNVRSLSPRPVDSPFARVVIAFPWAMVRTK